MGDGDWVGRYMLYVMEFLSHLSFLFIVCRTAYSALMCLGVG